MSSACARWEAGRSKVGCDVWTELDEILGSFGAIVVTKSEAVTSD